MKGLIIRVVRDLVVVGRDMDVKDLLSCDKLGCKRLGHRVSREKLVVKTRP